ncbi:transmembrane protein 233-like [Corticium candelabrum]|uniref:transmembrane protein 233-like n=1 Tax=Corticium candelabrum TaxID=121492 RepID=UPI002E254C77|nr:transmembrane protein 233-like [Corticium candelabrum]
MEEAAYPIEKSSDMQPPPTYRQQQQPPEQFPTQPQSAAYIHTHQPQQMVYLNTRQPQHYPAMRQTVVNAPMVRDYMAASIFTCLCCFWPIGLFAILYSCKVREARQVGDDNNALKYSKTVRILNVVGVIFGLIFLAALIAVLATQTSIIRVCATTDRRNGKC